MTTFIPMTVDSLDAVLAIETLSHHSPWTRGNFMNSLSAGHATVLMREDDVLQAYAVLMPLPDEVELLNITVAPTLQRRGLGRRLLDHVCRTSQDQGAQRMFLEVRASNVPARTLYRQCGFAEVGLRKAYYAADNNMREDAILMAKELLDLAEVNTP